MYYSICWIGLLRVPLNLNCDAKVLIALPSTRIANISFNYLCLDLTLNRSASTFSMSKVITTKGTSLTLASEPSYELSIRNYTDFQDTFIFTNGCSLSVDELKAKNIHLHTSSFQVPSKGIVSTSGNAGKKQETAGNNADGSPGSSFSFSTSDFDVERTISVNARGGDGGEGYSGVAAGLQGGNGGNGGAGGNVILLFNDTFRNLVLRAHGIKSDSTPSERQSSVEEWLIHARSIIQPQSLVDLIHQFERDYSSMTADVFATTLKKISDDLNAESLRFSGSLPVACTGGSYGTGGEPGGLNGRIGASGSYTRSRMTPTNIRSSTECLFHPDQVAMTIRDAENNYFIGTSDSLLAAKETFGTIVDRLSFLGDLRPNDELFKAYQGNERSLFVISPPQDEPGSDQTLVPTSITSLRNSLALAQHYTDQLSTYLDFFGHARNWVPRISRSLYAEQLDKMLLGFNDVEKNYNNYQSIANKQIKRQDQIDLAVEAADISRSHAEDDVTTLGQEIRLTADRIKLLQAGLPNKRNDLDKAMDDVADTIKNSFKVSFSQFIGAVGQMAFAPGLPMTAVQGANILHGAATKVTDDTGNEVPKEYMVNKIYTIKADMDGLDEAVKANGAILEMNDPGATKLMADERDVMNLVSQYRGLLGDAVVHGVKKRFDDYVQAVLDRNNQVIHYNACITLWLQAQAKIDSCKSTAASLGRARLEDIDFEIPAAAAAVECSYFDTTRKIISTLYLAQKAMEFVSFSTDEGLLTKLRQHGFPRPGLSAALMQARIDLVDKYDSVVDSFGSDAPAFGSGDILPVVVPLTAEQVDTLRENEEVDGEAGIDEFSVMVNLTPCFKETTRLDSPFSGYADVRLTDVKLYVEGATVADNSLQISLQHMGSETIVDPMNVAHRYTHNPVNLEFQYDLKTGKLFSPATIARNVEGTYALPGPFCMWRIAISKISNENLDLRGITKSWFEFSGVHRVFDPSAALGSWAGR